MKYEVFIKNDVAYVVIPETPDTIRVQPVMTKDAFIECYEKWIKPRERKDEVEDDCALTGWETEPNDYCSSGERESDFYLIENDGTYSAGDGDEIQEPEDKDC